MQRGRVIVPSCKSHDPISDQCSTSCGACEAATSDGLKALHVTEIGLEKASDSTIWQYALTKQFILISKGEDFAQRKILAKSSPGIV